jgi:hypothetical protein
MRHRQQIFSNPPVGRETRLEPYQHRHHPFATEQPSTQNSSGSSREKVDVKQRRACDIFGARGIFFSAGGSDQNSPSADPLIPYVVIDNSKATKIDGFSRNWLQFLGDEILD